MMDASEVHALAAHLSAAPAKVIASIVPVAHRAGVAIKRTMKADASGHKGLGGLPGRVSCDVDASATSVAVVVGFDKRGQGNLANIAAFGSVNNAPVMDITRGLSAEIPKFVEWVAKVGGEAL